MASVIGSARQSTASIFDLVGSISTTATSVVNTAALAVDALDSKTRLMHHGVITNTKFQMPLIEHRELVKAASEYVEIMEESHRRNFPGKEFDREECYLSAIKQIQEATSQT